MMGTVGIGGVGGQAWGPMNTLSKSFNEEPNWSVPQPLAIVPSSWQVSVCAAAAQGRGRGGDEAGAAGERTNTDRLRQKYNLSPRVGGAQELEASLSNVARPYLKEQQQPYFKR